MLKFLGGFALASALMVTWAARSQAPNVLTMTQAFMVAKAAKDQDGKYVYIQTDQDGRVICAPPEAP